MSIFTDVKNAILPGRKERLRRLVFSVADGNEFDVAEAGDSLRGVTVEKFRKLVETRKKRLSAAADLKADPAEEKQLADLDAARNQARADAIAAEQNYRDAVERSEKAALAFQALRAAITYRRGDAMNFLQATADKSIADELQAVQGSINSVESSLEAFRDVTEKHRAASVKVEQLTAELATKHDPTERAFTMAQLADARDQLKSLEGRNKNRSQLEKQLAELQSRVDAISATRHDPDHMQIIDTDSNATRLPKRDANYLEED